MSRVMVHLFARLARLLSRVSRSNLRITEFDNPDELELPSVSPSTASINDPLVLPSTTMLNSIISPESHAMDPLFNEARLLNADVGAWIESLSITTLEHERVQVGNRAYAHAMKVWLRHCAKEGRQVLLMDQILLLRRVFMYPREDGRVQEAALEVLKHCSTSAGLLGMAIEYVNGFPW
jgi:hypothetical protein